MPLLIAILLGLAAAVVTLYPLLGLRRTSDVSPAALTGLAERERLAKDALREVEFDYRLGNLEAPDYEDLRDRYEQRALAALKARYQREQELDALIERQLDILRGRQAPQARRAEKGAGKSNGVSGRVRRRQGGASHEA
ncbi:MAG TPA: hypothetical protein VH393_16315 [Ktedonobacterales bacterium]|jgi:hypothetical protein